MKMRTAFKAAAAAAVLALVLPASMGAADPLAAAKPAEQLGVSIDSSTLLDSLGRPADLQVHWTDTGLANGKTAHYRFDVTSASLGYYIYGVYGSLLYYTGTVTSPTADLGAGKPGPGSDKTIAGTASVPYGTAPDAWLFDLSVDAGRAQIAVTLTATVTNTDTGVSGQASAYENIYVALSQPW
jgi:hypothetical protein